MIQPRANSARLCPCGNLLTAFHAQACSRCAFLDGNGRLERLIIDAIRDADGSIPQPELREAIYTEDPGISQRAIFRAVAHLERKGRIRRRSIDHWDDRSDEKLIELIGGLVAADVTVPRSRGRMAPCRSSGVWHG